MNRRHKFWVCLLFLASCAKPPQTVSEIIIDHDYYAYLPSDDYLQARKWTPLLEKEEDHWSLHCGGPSAPWNPLFIDLVDEQNEVMMAIELSNQAVIWDRNKPLDVLEVESAWAKDNAFYYYRDEPFLPLKFVDTVGNVVVIRGAPELQFSEDQLRQFLDALEYVGARPVEDILNPWSATWCELYD